MGLEQNKKKKKNGKIWQKKNGNKYQAKNYFNFIHCCALACVISFQTPIQMQAFFF